MTQHESPAAPQPAAGPKTSYSQFGEDVQLLRLFPRGHRGCFVDVGANDGVTGSNSYLLELNGWHGVLVEPVRRLADLCRERRPGSVVMNYAVVGDPAIASVTLYEYAGANERGEPFDAMSSAVNRSEYERYIKAQGGRVLEVPTPAATLNEILIKAGVGAGIDVLSVDVEGMEYEVLRGFSVARYRPRVILSEDNSFGADKRVSEYLARQGYVRVHRTVVNDWYVARGEARRFLRQRLVLGCRLWVWATLGSSGARRIRRAIRNQPSLAEMVVAKLRVARAGDAARLREFNELTRRRGADENLGDLARRRFVAGAPVFLLAAMVGLYRLGRRLAPGGRHPR